MRLKRYVFWMFCLGLLFASNFGCKHQASEEGVPVKGTYSPREKNSIILKVADSFYFNSDFEKYLLSIVGQEYKDLSVSALSRLFDDFVDEKILLRAAKDQETSLTVDEQKEYLAKLTRESWSNGRKSLLDELEYETLLEKLVIEKYLSQKIERIDVTDQEVKDYYELHKREFLRPERVRVSQILLKTEGKAVEILEKIKDSSGEAFRELARKESIGVEASKGGEMGLFEMGQLPSEMEKVVFALKVGEISPVVESSYGYHIFRLDEKLEPELVPEDSALPEIKIKIFNERIQKFLRDHMVSLKSRLDWNSYPNNLSFSYQRIDHDESE
ncbi:MAG: peptidyl-prolyl cis-trans isomerase [Candidatus Aminicenantes bacterium]